MPILEICSLPFTLEPEEYSLDTAPKTTAEPAIQQPIENITPKANTKNENVKPTKIKTIKEIKTEQTLAKAGITNDVIARMLEKTQSPYSDLVPATLRMIEYLENRIAKGEKLTPKLINEAIRDCDGIYAQPGYGSAFQEAQKGLLAKY